MQQENFAPVTITVTNDGRQNVGHLIQCDEHAWFKEWTSNGEDFAEDHALRHLATYHKRR